MSSRAYFKQIWCFGYRVFVFYIFFVFILLRHYYAYAYQEKKNMKGWIIQEKHLLFNWVNSILFYQGSLEAKSLLSWRSDLLNHYISTNLQVFITGQSIFIYIRDSQKILIKKIMVNRHIWGQIKVWSTYFWS
jgi:hypothetical protein